MAQQVGGNQYLYIRIACPVDVTVEKAGEVLSSDERQLSTRTSFGTLMLTGEGEEQEKILRLDAAKDYEITIEGTGRDVYKRQEVQRVLYQPRRLER